MKINCFFCCLILSLSFGLFICYPAVALHTEFDNKKDIADWELGSQTATKIVDGKLELKAAGGQNSGIYFDDKAWTDYTMEIQARK